jgi:hypothetical protein
MWTTILSYTLSSTNYNITNVNNLYNFIISIMDEQTEEQNQKLIDSLLINMGRTFYKNFRQYLINKVPNSIHLKTINRIV